MASRAGLATATQTAQEAIAALEPLRAENSRINTVIGELQAQVDAAEAADVLEDAALAEAVAFLETPPTEEPPVENPPADAPATDLGTPTVTDGNADAPADDSDIPST